MLNRFFVYGTLRPGEVRWSALESYAIKQEPAVLTGAQLYTTGPWPFVVIDGYNRSVVQGEMITVADENVAQVIMMLDRIEGYNPRDEKNTYNLFIRSVESIQLPIRAIDVQAYVYLGGIDLAKDAYINEYRRIESGDWKQR